jgi:hypothetical protein
VIGVVIFLDCISVDNTYYGLVVATGKECAPNVERLISVPTQRADVYADILALVLTKSEHL